jgi:hypothetical protein
MFKRLDKPKCKHTGVTDKMYKLQVIYGCDISSENAGHYKSYMSVAFLLENAEHLKVKHIINKQKIFDHFATIQQIQTKWGNTSNSPLHVGINQ